MKRPENWLKKLKLDGLEPSDQWPGSNFTLYIKRLLFGQYPFSGWAVEGWDACLINSPSHLLSGGGPTYVPLD